jgi:hypothetical protein
MVVTDKYIFSPVLYKIFHAQTPDGELGFWETIFYIENIGSSMDASKVSMTIEVDGKTFPLEFSPGISVLAKGERMEYPDVPPLLVAGVGAIVLRDQDMGEIARSSVKIIRNGKD